MNVGNIRWVDFPQANGREQQGRRPAIVMQDDRYANRSFCGIAKADGRCLDVVNHLQDLNFYVVHA